MKLLCLLSVGVIATLGTGLASVQKSIPRIIVNVDAGLDDAFAIFQLLHADMIGILKVEAIICSNGNSNSFHTCRNTVRVLEALKRTNVPVYKGAYRSIIPVPEDIPAKRRYFYGKDGFADISHANEPNMDIIKGVPAAVAIHELVVNNPNEITVVNLGPLTTLALAMLQYDDLAENIKELWIMGGNIELGNITDEAEFNFFIDPEAANIVINNGKCPITLLTWDDCLKVDITLGWRFKALGLHRSEFMDLLNRSESAIFKDWPLDSVWGECDTYVATAIAYPEAILKKISQKGVVELNHTSSRGKLMLTDDGKNNNVVLVKKLNTCVIASSLLSAATVS